MGLALDLRLHRLLIHDQRNRCERVALTSRCNLFEG